MTTAKEQCFIFLANRLRLVPMRIVNLICPVQPEVTRFGVCTWTCRYWVHFLFPGVHTLLIIQN